MNITGQNRGPSPAHFFVFKDLVERPADPPVFLPTWLPGETLYSLCARYHRLSGNRLAGDTSLQLFAAPDAGFLHDFPSHLESFVARTQGVLGSVDDLARGHTLLGFYIPFRKEQDVTDTILIMAGDSVRDLKFRLGLPASRVGADHPLKACPACVESDRRKEGGSYWHLEHQWPSVWVCQKHEQLLHVCVGRNKKRNRRQWVLPEDMESSLWWKPPDIEPVARSFLIRLTRVTTELTGQCGIAFEPERIRKAFLLEARGRGWLRETHGVRLAEIRNAFLAETAGISAFPGMEFVSGVARADGGFLGGLLHRTHKNRHPVKHLLLICLLFEDWDRFVTIYEAAQTIVQPEDLRRAALATMVIQNALSISEAARRLGLPLSKAIFWAQKDGVPYRRRPCLIDKEVAAVLSVALRNGGSCNEVAAQIGLPVVTVRRFLDTHAAIRSAWNRSRKR